MYLSASAALQEFLTTGPNSTNPGQHQNLSENPLFRPIPTHTNHPRTPPPPTIPAHANPSTTPTMRTQPHATPPPSSLQVPPHSMTSDPTDLRDVACRRIVGELSVLYLQASDPVSLMTRECKPCGNCTVSIFLCPDYVIHCPVYKSNPLYGLDLSLLLKGLTLQRAPCL